MSKVTALSGWAWVLVCDKEKTRTTEMATSAGAEEAPTHEVDPVIARWALRDGSEADWVRRGEVSGVDVKNAASGECGQLMEAGVESRLCLSMPSFSCHSSPAARCVKQHRASPHGAALLRVHACQLAER